MFSSVMKYNGNDAEAGRILDSFLPDRIFDAHCHLLDTSLIPTLAGEGERVVLGAEKYREEMSPLLRFPRELRMNAISYPDAAMRERKSGLIEKSDAFLLGELEKDETLVGEIVVHPDEKEEDIEKRIVDPRIRGLKCYHNLSNVSDTWQASIGDYLPRSAWEVANAKRMVITQHMVRDGALSDPDNLEYIRETAKSYPYATLILAHCARAFASWTAVESAERVKDLPNVWFDFSAVCESPAMIQILNKVGVERCMWGSDYPVCRARGKCISLGNSFYWIYQKDLDAFSSKTRMSDHLIGTENLMAVRQAFLICGINEDGIERFFYGNAKSLFDGE